MTLGKFLKERRKALGISQVTLGKKLGYTCSQYISKYERGLNGPPMSKSGKICELLEIDKKKYKDLLVKEYKKKLEKVLGV